MVLAKFEHEVQNRARIRTAINVITQRDDGVVMAKFDEINERRQCVYAAMNIANCEMTCHEKSPLVRIKLRIAWMSAL